MKKLFLFVSIIVLAITCYSQSQVIDLWNGNLPTSTEEGSRLDDKPNTNSNITVFLPQDTTTQRKAVIICPGGGYGGLAFQHEGTQVAQWLSEQGIVGIVLRYRLPNGRSDVPLQDVRQAFRVVRQNANRWGVDTSKIGIMGFSAGGHLASSASTKIISDETRPAFSILYYPVISLFDDEAHKGSRKNLLGKMELSSTAIAEHSSHLNISTKTPPTLLFLSDDDKTVLPINSILYYEGLKKNKIPATMYIFPSGGHGWGIREDFKYRSEMLLLLSDWLKNI